MGFSIGRRVGPSSTTPANFLQTTWEKCKPLQILSFSMGLQMVEQRGGKFLNFIFLASMGKTLSFFFVHLTFFKAKISSKVIFKVYYITKYDLKILHKHVFARFSYVKHDWELIWVIPITFSVIQHFTLHYIDVLIASYCKKI